jgi:hypothetical protein
MKHTHAGRRLSAAIRMCTRAGDTLAIVNNVVPVLSPRAMRSRRKQAPRIKSKHLIPSQFMLWIKYGFLLKEQIRGIAS